MSIERSQYHETKILRHNSPVRNARGSAVNLSQFDNKLDDLLDDLQSSVGNDPYRRSRSNKIIDRSTGSSVNKLLINTPKSNPDVRTEEVFSYKGPIQGNGLQGYEEKNESYVQETGSGRAYTESKKSYVQKSSSTSKLDPLLNNLKQINGSANDSDYRYDSSSKFSSSKRNISESTVTHQNKLRSEHSPSVYDSEVFEKVESQILPQSVEYVKDSETYLSSNQAYHPSTTSKKVVHIKNVQTQPLEVIEASVPDIDPEVLENLDPNLLPTGNTKVTTTIKTYTYEIPADRTLGRDGSLKRHVESDVKTQKYSYSPNTTITTPSKSFVYEKNSENLLQQKKEYDYMNRSRSLERHRPANWREDLYRSHSPGSQKETYVYKESISSKDRSYYPGSETHIKEIVDERYKDSYNWGSQGPNRQPEREPLLTPSRPSHSPKPTRLINYEYQKTSSDERTKSPPVNRINEPINIKYQYSSKLSTSNNYTGSGYDDRDNIPIRPFPVEESVDGPPKKLDDLMANIGKEPNTNSLNVGFLQHEQELINRKKANELKKQAEEVEDIQRKKEALAPTKNVTGSPVYYPPGHELFQKKEEAAAGWRAEGAYAREGGKYKYEAESGSKSKSKSGAAVVPVCLPCCCGLPCTII